MEDLLKNSLGLTKKATTFFCFSRFQCWSAKLEDIIRDSKMMRSCPAWFLVGETSQIYPR